MTAFYAGLDVSDQETWICIIDAKGVIVAESRSATTPTAIAKELKPYARMLERVGHEAGSKSSWLHKALIKRRLPMVCLHARAARGALAGQRHKTDRNDARGIAQIVRAGWYTTAYVKSDEAQRLRLLLTHRLALRRKAADLENTLRHSLKAFGAKCVKKDGRLVVSQSTRTNDPMISRLSQIMLRASANLRSEVEALDKLVISLAKRDAVCVRLMTMPGVGPLTALGFRSAIDDPARFRSSRSVGVHFGLTPRRRQSGQMDIMGHISKIGDESVRCALFEAAFALIVNSKSKCPLRLWGAALRKRHGLKFACVACARKMAVILHRMWVTERDFDPAPAPRRAL